MDAWSEWNDPVELRMRLDAALVEIVELTQENNRLRRQLGLGVPHPMPERHAPGDGGDQQVVHGVPRPGLPYADATSAAEEKLALFRALFVGRMDVYARRWVSSRTGRAGWGPAEEDPWDKTKPDAERVFFPLSDQVIFRHLSRPEPGQRELHVGLYPMLPDDTTRLLVCDFDDKDWRGDAAAYVSACADAGVPALVEVSRSGGRGARVDVLHRSGAGRFGSRWAWLCCGARSMCAAGCLWPATTG